jgi:hypothetical protein
MTRRGEGGLGNGSMDHRSIDVKIMVIISIISNGSAARISDRIGDIWGSQIQSFLVTWKVEDS